MNRDALLATLIGLALGLIITGLLIVGPQLAQVLPKINLPELSFLTPSAKRNTSTATSPKPVTFAVESPLPEAIERERELVVSGSSQPQSVVVVAGANDEDVSTVGPDGKFAGKITLSEGKNVLTVTQYLNGKPTFINLTVYYTQDNF